MYSQFELNGTSKYSPDDGICGQQQLTSVKWLQLNQDKCKMHQQLHTTLWHIHLYSPSRGVCCTKVCCNCMYDTSHSATEATCFKENGSLIGSRRTGTAKICQLRKPSELNGGQQWEQLCTCDKCITRL